MFQFRIIFSLTGKGTKDLAITSIYPANQLCKCGNEKITVQLNTDSEKNGKSRNKTTIYFDLI